MTAPPVLRLEDLNSILARIQAIEDCCSSREDFQKYLIDFQHHLYQANSALQALQPCLDTTEQGLVKLIYLAARNILAICTEKRTIDCGADNDHHNVIRSVPTNLLKEWFTAHRDYPYPTEKQKTVLVECTGMSRRQISMWFINARRRAHKGKKFMAEQVSDVVRAIVSEYDHI